MADYHLRDFSPYGSAKQKNSAFEPNSCVAQNWGRDTPRALRLVAQGLTDRNLKREA